MLYIRKPNIIKKINNSTKSTFKREKKNQKPNSNDMYCATLFCRTAALRRQVLSLLLYLSEISFFKIHFCYLLILHDCIGVLELNQKKKK